MRAVMQHALGEERAATMLARITPPARSRAFNALRWMDAKTIAALVENEHPQNAALVLANHDAAIAADDLQLLPADMQSDRYEEPQSELQASISNSSDVFRLLKKTSNS